MSAEVKKKSLKNIFSKMDEVYFSLLSIFLALFISIFFVMSVTNKGFFDSAAVFLTSFWKGSFGTKQNFIETLVFTTPLIFTGLANAVAFKTGLFNIGVSGQFVVGMLVAAIIGLIPGIPTVIHILLILAAGLIVGAIWGGIPGFLKAKFGTNEVVNTIMMNYIAMYVSNYFTMGPFHMKSSASTPVIQKSGMLWRFLGQNYRLNIGIFIGLAFVVLVYILFWKTTIGYEIRAVGLNASAAEYGGINVKKNIILAMVISGAIAGIGGATLVSGVQQQSQQLGALPSYGFDGITVALIAKNNPIAIIFSSILIAALNYSSGTLMLYGIPKQMCYMIQGIIIIFIAGETIFRKFGKKKKEAVING